ncbi:hypothetical protein LRX75_11415 [Rhizobium sp. DKSPLA3]|uniref:Uncharacterized protein n=1 Tax=Rhizobium quercicola TaxID=2901226 RepID=A0A9X1NTY0_9HYPH|nr:hypothetical protein [Rhizobium quercicola]MCD7109654.1 hypothetical protein [Rhizobium quercicola]
MLMKDRRRQVRLLMFGALLTLASPAQTHADQLLDLNKAETVKSATAGEELIGDPTFSAGFSATPKCNSPTERACADDKRYRLKLPSYPKLAAIKPVWEIRQWGSRSSFLPEAKKFGSGYGWETPDKRLVVYPDGAIEMAVNGDSEMEGQYDNKRPSKPSLIAGQTIAAPGDYSRDTGSLHEMSQLIFNLDFRLMYENQNKKNGYDPKLNAFSLPVNFTIQNLNNKSSGYGQYVWLQINPYDDRHEKPIRSSDESMVDYGTKMLIYFVPTDRLTAENSHSGEWINLHGDILPYAIRSVQIAADRGILKSGDLTDYKIGGVNIGYELTGLNITTVMFRNLSLKKKGK